MKAVLISVQPKWCELIASGKKTIEVRKTRPKINMPFKCYIYMTATKERCRYWEYITAYQNRKGDILNGSQKVIGEFVCDEIIKIIAYPEKEDTFAIEYEKGLDAMEQSCLSIKEAEKYAKGKPLYGWHITDMKIYEKPKNIKEFLKPCPYGELPCSNCPSCERDENDNLIQCFNTVSRPPQSWCYVEDLK